MTARLFGAAAAVIATALTAGSAQAQEADVQRAYNETTDAPLSSDISKPAGVEIQTNDGGSQLIMRYGSLSTASRATKDANLELVYTLGLTLSAPLDDGAKTAPAATLDGLARGSTIEASWSRLSLSRPLSSDYTTIAKAEDALCNAIAERYAQRFAERAQSTGGDRGANAFDAAKTQALAEATKAKFEACDDGFVERFEPASLDAFQRLHWGKDAKVKVYGISVRTGRVVFNYIDPATVAERQVEKTGWSVKAFYAIQPLSQPWLFTASFEHMDGFKAKDDATICPVGGGACLTGPNGAPVHNTQDLFKAEARRSFRDFGVSFSVTYDSEEDVYAAELPIYLTRDSAGAFNGGVKLNWRSDQDDVVASVFVGRTLSLGWPGLDTSK